jgi:hypothetical protein
MTRILKLSLCISAFCPLAPVNAQTITVVIQEGEAAPDGNGSFFGFDPPVLNDAGQAAFIANLTGTSDGSTDDHGIYRSDGLTDPTQIAREGQAAPDGNGTFFTLSAPALNEAGQAAFRASLAGTRGGSFDNQGLFLGDGLTGPTQVARGGQFAPDGNGRFAAFANPALNDAGQAAFRAELMGTIGGSSDDRGIFRGDGMTSLTQIARAGQAAPNGNSFSDFVDPAVNDAGQAAFRANLTGTVGNRGIFLGGGVSGLTQIIATGQSAPDGNGTLSSRAYPPAINNAGQTAFFTGVGSTSGGSLDNQGLFRSDGVANLTQIVRKGDTAPDGNGTFSGFGLLPALNDVGQAAFIANLTGTSGGSTDDRGIYRGDGLTGPMQFAREGQAAPGGNGRLSIFLAPALNDAGQAAFLASLTGTNGGFSDDRGIFFHDDTLGLIEVTREGDALLGSTITNLGFSGSLTSNGDERSGLNELGQVAYRFELADGNSGIAIWTIPEPSTAVLLALAGLTLLRRRQVDYYLPVAVPRRRRRWRISCSVGKPFAPSAGN